MKRIIVLLLATICLCTLISCETKEEDITKEEVNTSNSDEVTEHYTIDTPYCTLKLPLELKEVVDCEMDEDPCILLIKVKENDTPLYSISFGVEAETVFGTLPTDDGNIVLYSNIYSFEDTDPNYNDYMTYQESLGYIADNLASDYKFIVGSAIIEEKVETYDIPTSVITLKYPVKWKDKVTVDVTDTAVFFSYNGTKLFDICFTECNGDLYGMCGDTPVYIMPYDINSDSVTPEEYNELFAMQDDMNVILRSLSDDSNFISNY